MPDANCPRIFPHEVKFRQLDDVYLDQKGKQYVRFVIAPLGCSSSKYDNLGCAVRVVLQYCKSATKGASC